MQFRYLEDLTYADVAFEAEGDTLEELFQSAASALMQIMVENLNSIYPKTTRRIQLKGTWKASSDAIADLLCEFLQKLIYWKDVDQLLLRVQSVRLNRSLEGNSIELVAETSGEEIDPRKHALGNDIKGVTYHQLKVWKENSKWKAIVVVDT